MILHFNLYIFWTFDVFKNMFVILDGNTIVKDNEFVFDPKLKGFVLTSGFQWFDLRE